MSGAEKYPAVARRFWIKLCKGALLAVVLLLAGCGGGEEGAGEGRPTRDNIHTSHEPPSRPTISAPTTIPPVPSVILTDQAFTTALHQSNLGFEAVGDDRDLVLLAAQVCLDIEKGPFAPGSHLDAQIPMIFYFIDEIGMEYSAGFAAGEFFFATAIETYCPQFADRIPPQ